MAIQGTNVPNMLANGRKWHYVHIQNGFVTPRRGKVVLRWTGQRGWGINYWIKANGIMVAQIHVGGGSWGCTISADVPAGVTIEAGGGGNLEFYIFQEF